MASVAEGPPNVPQAHVLSRCQILDAIALPIRNRELIAHITR